MAERIERTEKTVVEVTHYFQCDDCGKDLGSSVEYEDGFYDNLGSRTVGIHIPGHGWYHSKQCLCDDCYAKWLTKCGAYLEYLGFKKETTQ